MTQADLKIILLFLIIIAADWLKKKAKKSKQKKLNYNFKVKVNKTYELNIILFADYTKQK